MKSPRIVVAGLVLAGIGAAVFWAGARAPGAWLASESRAAQDSSAPAEAPGVQAPQPSGSPIASSNARVAREAPPPAETAERTTRIGKGRSLFEGPPLQRPELPLSTQGAIERADQGARARALSPRAERHLESMRAKLATATGEERRHLQLAIESLENNLRHRRERARWARGDASRD